MVACHFYFRTIDTLTWKIQEHESEPRSRSQHRNSKLLHVPPTGISRRGGTRPRIIRITRSCRTESRIGLYWDPSQFDVLGSVAMISDEQSRVDRSRLTKEDERMPVGVRARRNKSHPAFAAGGHTRIPFYFPRSIR